ncbi:MAG: metal ABC transporter permease [Deltaproteobacteria bacterium]|nr:metal ABC transporter permease [Deltaproteobacteria bacterium]
MVELIKEPFVTRAITCGLLISILLSGLGLFLVLRRLSLIGDGLAHVSFGGISLGILLERSPFYIAIPICVFASVGILKVRKVAKMYPDAAIGIVSSLGIASGAILSSLKGGFNVEILSYLFGSILSVTTEDMVLSLIFMVIFLAYTFLFYNDLVSSAFDEELAYAEGVDVEKINTVLSVFTAITIVLGIKVVGLLLVTSLLILPPVTALQFSTNFRATFLLSVLFGMTSVVVGIFISVVLDVPPGSSIVITNFGIFLIVLSLQGKKLLTKGKK